MSLLLVFSIAYSASIATYYLPFDSNTAKQFAAIATRRKTLDRPISQIDAQIAAITRSHNATLARRNISDFEECEITIVNPWKKEL
ncbi:MAG: type II toxin-antitoxin system VapC family toxin [Waterburya sp.]